MQTSAGVLLEDEASEFFTSEELETIRRLLGKIDGKKVIASVGS